MESAEMSQELEDALDAALTDPGANRVLVVEDDLTQRMMLVRILRNANYDSEAAMSNEEARTRLEGSAFGLLVVDLHMFAEDGIELVRELADRYPDTCSIVVSGFVTEDDKARIQQAGAFDVMTKPIDPKLFLSLVGRAFEQRLLRGTVA